MNAIINIVVFGNRVSDYLNGFAVFLSGIIIILVFRRFILVKLAAIAGKTRITLDDFLIEVLKKYCTPVLYFGAFYLGIHRLTLHLLFNKIINILGLAVLTIFSIRFLTALISYGFHNYLVKKATDPAKERGFKGILSVIKVIMWGLGVVFFLDNLGFKVSTVIAGLGIGGVAIALAAQTILGDLFSYLAILFDRPFEIGDFIVVGDFLGTIEHIGIKTTRIRSLNGEQIVFSNSDLTNSRTRNYKRMDKRRVTFRIGVTYQTSLVHTKEIPSIVKTIIERIQNTLFDRAHFFTFGDSGLIFEVVYYVLSQDYNKYMDIQQDINFAIKEAFEKRGIEFAYPTQTLYIAKTLIGKSN